VQALCRHSAGHYLILATITSVEVASALARKVRDGRWSAVRRDQHWRLFRSHTRTRYRLIVPNDLTYRHAQRLLFTHPLRAFDAFQLATALQGQRLLGDLAFDFRFCTADRVQAAAAITEGLQVELIS
jgi:hypothetical protein